MHSTVAGRSGSPRTDHEAVEAMIKLFDKEAVKEMLLERCSVCPGALTPLGMWMFYNTKQGYCKHARVLEVLANYSSGEDLEMINGEGDLPLHVVSLVPSSVVGSTNKNQAVRENRSLIITYLLKRNPSLLFRENATGRTPLEMARDAYTTSQVNKPLSTTSTHMQRYNPGRLEYDTIVQKNATDFLDKEIIEESPKRTWEICDAVDQEVGEGEKKRRLVSLFEANEVAKRVAAHGLRTQSGYVVNGGLVDGDVKTDIVSEWLS